MASADHNVEGLLDRMVSFYAQELQQIDFEEYFLIEEELGKGGYGNVFLVNDKQTGEWINLAAISVTSVYMDVNSICKIQAFSRGH